MYPTFAPISTIRPIAREHPLLSGLRDWWIMWPRDTNTSVFNAARTSRHATANNTLKSGPMPDRVSLTFPTAFGMTGVPAFAAPLTISCWVNPGVTSRGDLVTRWTDGADPGDQYALIYGLTTGKPQFYYANGSPLTTNGTAAGPTAMSVGTWHHVVGTHDGTTASCYLDGVLQGTDSHPINSSPSTAIRFGDNANGDGTFTGQLSDVMTFARCLNAAEVAQLYAESRAGYPNLLRRTRTFPILAPPPSGSGWLGMGYSEEDPMSITWGSWTTDLNAVTVEVGTDSPGSSLSLDGKAAAILSLEFEKATDDTKRGFVTLEYLKDKDGTDFETRMGDPNKQSRQFPIPEFGTTEAITWTIYASEGSAIKPVVRVSGCDAIVTLRTKTGTA